jgi:mono/diheme cytochrome c family protein
VKSSTALGLALPLLACGCGPDSSSGSVSSSGRSPDVTGEWPPPSDQSVPTASFPTSFVPPPRITGFSDSSALLPVRLSQPRTAAEPPPAISGGTLAVSADGRHVAAADPDRDAVYLVELPALKAVKVKLSAGSEPGRVAFDDAGAVHVALRGRGKLARIELSSGSVERESPLCEHPRGLAFDAANKLLVASCMDGTLVGLDAATHRENTRAVLPDDLRDVVIDATGRRWVARYRSAELLGLQPDEGVQSAARPRPVATQRGSAVSADLADLLANAGVSTGVDGTAGVASPTLAWRAIAGPSESVWMLHQQSQEGEVTVVQGGYGRDCLAITTGAITEFASDGEPIRSMPIALQGLSVDLALSPDQRWLALASPGGFAGSKPTIQVYSAAVMQAEPARARCPNVVASAGLESQTVAVSFDANGRLLTLSREPALLSIYRLDAPFASASQVTLMRTATLQLDAGSVRDTGHDLFHADVGSGLACASCHGEALDDGHVWTFQEIGPRRTQNLRGGLLATAPFHWNGDMPSFGHLVMDVMAGRMGGFAIEASYVAALGDWIDQLPSLSLPVSDEGAVARGKELFESEQAACASCHSGPLLTNNESADVGSGGSFQVPSLLGLGLHAPYMHNGCAHALSERFEPACGGTKHGDTSQLDTQQLADLVAYLSSL